MRVLFPSMIAALGDSSSYGLALVTREKIGDTCTKPVIRAKHRCLN